jgi:hypothetical protein
MSPLYSTIFIWRVNSKRVACVHEHAEFELSTVDLAMI